VTTLITGGLIGEAVKFVLLVLFALLLCPLQLYLLPRLILLIRLRLRKRELKNAEVHIVDKKGFDREWPSYTNLFFAETIATSIPFIIYLTLIVSLILGRIAWMEALAVCLIYVLLTIRGVFSIPLKNFRKVEFLPYLYPQSFLIARVDVSGGTRTKFLFFHEDVPEKAIYAFFIGIFLLLAGCMIFGVEIHL